ncbi:MAG: DUF2791 family P-loop domain-containing protein [Planctomycetes bacterium]|nr:DUF2791 family P-loop domain-containing protein [Planctomycetota bacterium]
MKRPELSAALARHLIQRMGETGQPPERGALAVNVGTDEVLDFLREDYLVPMKEIGRNSSFKVVQAPFGGGKTQFLHCLREVAWDLGFATSLVGVSPKECPFHDARKIYEAVVRAIELPPKRLEEEPRPGIDEVFRQVAQDRVRRYGEDVFKEWLDDEFSRSRVESRAFLRAAHLFMLAVIDREHETEDLLRSYFFCERVQPSELAPFGIRESVDESNAFRYLRSVVQTLRALELPGVVLLFDELDRVMSLTVKKRKEIGDNLRQMIDHCGQSTLPSMLWAYAVPPEFMVTVVPEYPALQQRLKTPGASFGPSNPMSPIIDLDRMPMSASELLEQIGERLLLLFEKGHDIQFDEALQRRNLHNLALELGSSLLESGTRRTFVKAAVQMLHGQRRDGESAVMEREISALAQRSAAEAPPRMEGEEVFE